MASSMRLYSLWSAAIAITLLSWAAASRTAWDALTGESLFIYALSLWHGIYAIWFWKGQTLAPFARASVYGRIAIALVYATAFLRRDPSLPPAFAQGWAVYLLVQAAADGLSAMRTWRVLPADGKGPQAPRRSLRAEEQNRLLFAVYMLLLSAWMLVSANGFLAFFHLPGTSFHGWSAAPGPIHLLTAQISLLACFNLVAVRHRLTALIDAGVRGGMFTCVFFMVLVGLGLLHPLTLLLPAVDLLSVAWIFVARRAVAT